MPNFDPKPEDMPYGEWLRQKNIGIKMIEPIHEDSGLPKDIHSHLKDKNVELYEAVLSGGKEILPEDM